MDAGDRFSKDVKGQHRESSISAVCGCCVRPRLWIRAGMSSLPKVRAASVSQVFSEVYLGSGFRGTLVCTGGAKPCPLT